MAGTRLLIQGTFVLEFFLLALAALYFGLYRTKDPISFHLPNYQRGRSILRQTLTELETDESLRDIQVPLVQVAATRKVASQLEVLLQKDRIELEVLSVEADDLAPVCQFAVDNQEADKEDTPFLLNGKRYSILVCPSGMAQSKELPSTIIHKGVTLLFPETDKNVESLFQQLLSTHKMPLSTKKFTRRPLQWTLMMEHRRDWNAWAQALSSWMMQNGRKAALESWPCVRGQLETQVVLSTLEGTAKAGTTSMRQISTTSLKESVLDQQADPNNAWNVLLYIPRVSPAQFVDTKTGETSNAMYNEHTLVATIDQPEQQSQEETITTVDQDGNETISIKTIQVPVPFEELITDAMTPLTEFLLQACMGVDSSSSNTATSLPVWQLEAWLQRILKDTYQQARTELLHEGEWLLESSTWVVIDETVAAHWQTLHQQLQQVQQQTTTTTTEDGTYGPYLEALHLLEDMLQHLQALRTDPTLMEPLRFSLPQFLAIFAPLCLPLFLPHLIGLVREYKRYKQLREKKSKKE